MAMIKWDNLRKFANSIIELCGGHTKSDSGAITVFFTNAQGWKHIRVEIGGYDINGFDRNHVIGWFGSEEEAYIATLAKLSEIADLAIREVKECLMDKTNDCCDKSQLPALIENVIRARKACLGIISCGHKNLDNKQQNDRITIAD